MTRDSIGGIDRTAVYTGVGARAGAQDHANNRVATGLLNLLTKPVTEVGRQTCHSPCCRLCSRHLLLRGQSVLRAHLPDNPRLQQSVVRHAAPRRQRHRGARDHRSRRGLLSSFYSLGPALLRTRVQDEIVPDGDNSPLHQDIGRRRHRLGIPGVNNPG